jgi:hypothetical protein
MEDGRGGGGSIWSQGATRHMEEGAAGGGGGAKGCGGELFC